MNEHIYIAPLRWGPQGRSQLNRWVLSFFANVLVDSDEVRRSTGRLFHVAAGPTRQSLSDRSWS